VEDGLLYLDEDMVKTLEASEYKDEVRQSRFERKTPGSIV
jgi:hypothetical protein